MYRNHTKSLLGTLAAVVALTTFSVSKVQAATTWWVVRVIYTNGAYMDYDGYTTQPAAQAAANVIRRAPNVRECKVFPKGGSQPAPQPTADTSRWTLTVTIYNVGYYGRRVRERKTFPNLTRATANSVYQTWHHPPLSEVYIQRIR